MQKNEKNFYELIISQVRKKVSNVTQPALYYDNKTQFTSEPYLTDESEAFHQSQPVRRGSQRHTKPQNNVSSNASGKSIAQNLYTHTHTRLQLI